MYLRLAEEDERSRREAQEALDKQIKSAWEEDVRNRKEAQHRLDQQAKTAWEQAEERISNLDEEAHLKASALLTTAEREAKLPAERAEARVEQLRKERGEIVAGLNEISRWIEGTVKNDRADAMQAAADDPAGE